jgi:hypothetical protein
MEVILNLLALILSFNQPVIDYKQINQTRINQVTASYKANTQLESKKLSGNNFAEINRGFYQVNGSAEFKDRAGATTEQFIMLASTSKLATTVYGLSKSPAKVRINIGIIKELLLRNPKRILVKPDIYNPILKDKFKLTKAEINALASLSAGYTAVLNKMIAKDKKLEYFLPIDELLYHDLTLSSNSAAEAIKNVGIGDDAPPLAKAKMALLLTIPSYEYTISTANITHWRQSASNTGKLSEHANLLHRLATDYQSGKSTPIMRQLISSIKNNKQDFGFDFTNSKMGNQLRKQGWEILEKTGYYPVVFWVEDLANGNRAKYPTHMTFSTLVSLIPPTASNKQPITFSYYKNIEVVFPTEKVKDLSTGLSIPNDWNALISPNYLDNYLASVKKVNSVKFRNEVAAHLKTLI